MTARQTCTRCGAQSSPEDQFCADCGLRLAANAHHYREVNVIPLPPGNEIRFRATRKKTRRSWQIRWIVVLLVCMVALASFGTWRAYSMPIDGGPGFLTQSQPGDNPEGSIAIMLMGVDQADGDEIDVGVRPDFLSVLHLDPATGSCRILGIPRDSRVEVPGTGLTKINHALALGGVPLQREVVENFLGIEIDHFGLIDFAGLSGVVDSVGGITVQNPYEFTVGNQVFAQGELHLNGERALTFSRHRGGPDGDFGRMEKQQLVIRAILKELASDSPLQTVPQLLTAIEGHLRTDLALTDMIRLAAQFQSTCTTDTLETRTLTGANAMFADPVLNLDLWYVVIDPQEVENAVRWLNTGEPV